MMFVHIFILTLLLGLGKATLDVPCEKGCECSRGKATCTKLKTFPTKLPRHLRYLDVNHLNGSAIPPGALYNLPHLQEVRISNSKISSIRPCAFSNLDKLKISIENCDIHQIEAGAFRYISKKASISIKNSRIVRIYSFAFNDLQNLTSLEVYRCTFQTIGPFSFNNISFVDKIELSYNTFPVLPALTFRNVTKIDFYQMEFNKFFGFSCNPFGRLFWNVNTTTQVLNQFPCTCEVARFLRSNYALPNKTQQSFAMENMCYTPREKFLTKLVEEQGGCHSLIESACEETSDSKLDLICLRKSFKRTNVPYSTLPQATVNPTEPSTRDPNRLYTDEAEPFDPTAHRKDQDKDHPHIHAISSGGSNKKHEAADGAMREGSASSDREGSVSNDREGSAEGSAEGHSTDKRNKKSRNKMGVEVAQSTVSDPMSRRTERPMSNGNLKPSGGTPIKGMQHPTNTPLTINDDFSNTTPESYWKPGNRNIDSNSGVGAVKHVPPTGGPYGSRSTKSTSLEYRNRPNRSGQASLLYSNLIVLSFLLTIYFATFHKL